MATKELESFVTKFKYLCSAGYSTSLSLKAENGIAKISFDVSLGFLPPPTSQPPPQCVNMYSPLPSKKRNASYMRRQDKRRSNFTENNDTVVIKVNEVEKVETEKVNVQTNDDVNTAVVEADQNTMNGEVIVTVSDECHGLSNEIGTTKAEEAEAVMSTKNDCSLCDFSSKWANGLAMHISTIHTKTSQSKKYTSKYDQEMQQLTQNYWKTGNLENNMQVYVNALLDVENADVSDSVKHIEECKLESLWNKIKKTPP